MYLFGKCNESDRMSDLIGRDYRVLLIMSRFGIGIGVGEESIARVCARHGVDAATFLSVVNLLLDEDAGGKPDFAISIPSLLAYLHNSHDYFLGFRLPSIRAKLAGIVDGKDELSQAIMRYFDGYVDEVRKHMEYEEKTVFPYIHTLLGGDVPAGYRIDVFQKRHDRIEAHLSEFKNIMIRFYPSQSTNEVNGVLFDIFNCEQELSSHNQVEDRLLIPAIARLEGEPNKTGR